MLAKYSTMVKITHPAEILGRNRPNSLNYFTEIVDLIPHNNVNARVLRLCPRDD